MGGILGRQAARLARLRTIGLPQVQQLQEVAMRVRASGFTLIELMIVVAAIAILAAIALPSFNEQVRKSRRSTAVAHVASLQLELEKWRADHPSYAGSAIPASNSSSNPNYVFSVPAASTTATSYTITASPQGGQTGDRCGDLTATAGNKPQWATASCNN